MSPGVESLVSSPLFKPASQEGTLFVDHHENTTAICPGKCRLNFSLDFDRPSDPATYAAANPGSDGLSGDEEFPALPSLWTAVQREARHVKDVQTGLMLRGGNRWHKEGHHCGGYHPGKNVRQNPTPRHYSEAVGVYPLKGLLELPAQVLGRIDATLRSLEEQRRFAELSSIPAYR